MNEHSTVSPASLRRRGMLQTPLKLFPTDYDALETVASPPSSGGFPAPFGQSNHEPPQQEPQPPPHVSQPHRPPVLQIPTDPQPPARLSPPSNPFSSASPPGSPTIMHRNHASQPPLDTRPLTPPQSPTTVKRSPRPAPPSSSMASYPKKPPPRSPAEKALMQLLWVSRTIGAIVCITFILYVVAHVRKSHSLHVILEFFVTGDVFLFTAGLAMILFSNTLLGISASVLAFPHLGWYINFVCPFIGENYVFAYPNLAPILVGMHAHGAYVNEYLRMFLDLHYFWFLPAVLLILFANGGLTGKASVVGVLLQVVFYGVGKGVELYYPELLSHPLINFELRLVGGLVSIAVLKLISTIIYHFTVKVTNMATKKRN